MDGKAQIGESDIADDGTPIIGYKEDGSPVKGFGKAKLQPKLDSLPELEDKNGNKILDLNDDG